MLVTPQKRAALVDYFKSGYRIEYKKGQTVILPHDSPEYIYYIESGYVKAFSVTKYGEQNLHVIRRSDEIFPLIWVFTDEHRDVAYETMDTCIIWRQHKAEFLKFLEDNSDVSPVVLELAVRAYRTYAERVNTLEYRTVRERAVSFLMSCSRRFGTKHPNGQITINAPLRQTDIASSINASRETTSRELSALSRKGLICISDGSIVLQDVEALKALL